MELWNGRKGLAYVFRYQVSNGRPATITRRGSWSLVLEPHVIRSWEAAALTHTWNPHLQIIEEFLGAGDVIKSHGDAIYFLKLQQLVAHPVSLLQIRREMGGHEFMATEG